jgi:cysteine desulfurase
MVKYWDNAVTTPDAQRVLDVMLPYCIEIFGNACSDHIYGKQPKIAIEKSRIHFADLVNSDSKEIFFTSGANERINWAIKGFP